MREERSRRMRQQAVSNPPASDQRMAVCDDDIPGHVERYYGIGACHQTGDGSFCALAIRQHHQRGVTAHANPVECSLAFVADMVKRLEQDEVAIRELIGNKLIRR